MRSVARRLLPVILMTPVIAGSAVLAGCGGSGGGGSSPDAAQLLRDAGRTWAGASKNVDSYDLSMELSGHLSAPDDDTFNDLNGKAELRFLADHVLSWNGATLPTFAFTASVDGTIKLPDGTTSRGTREAGATIVNQQIYASWEGKDYALGVEGSKAAAEAYAKDGDTPTPDDLDPVKLAKVLDLDPSTWLDDPKVAAGPTLNGEATFAVSGRVKLKAVADDFVDGLSAAAKAFPEVPAAASFAGAGSLSGDDAGQLERTLSTRDATLYIAKNGHQMRGLKLHIVGNDVGEGRPSIDMMVDTRYTLNPKVTIKAPTSTAPITDLIVELQRTFPAFSSAFGG